MAGIVKPRSKLSESISSFPNIFQADVYVICKYAEVILDKNYYWERIVILNVSQATTQAISSKLSDLLAVEALATKPIESEPFFAVKPTHYERCQGRRKVLAKIATGSKCLDFANLFLRKFNIVLRMRQIKAAGRIFQQL